MQRDEDNVKKRFDTRQTRVPDRDTHSPVRINQDFPVLRKILELINHNK